MNPKLILNVAALSLCCFTQAQMVDVFIHFPKGSASLENESKIQLEQWAKSHALFSHYQVQLRGHTDLDADPAYNLKLSQQRNVSVMLLLADYGFKDVSYSSHGEFWPLCASSDENCMHMNRRVEVQLMDTEEERFLTNIVAETPQLNFVNHDELTVIHGREGSLIHVPPHAFVYSDGSIAKNVRLEFHEFVTIESCIRNGLTTTSDGELLRTGGMMYVKAFCGEREVSLAPGKTLNVLFPSMAAQPDTAMQGFTGIYDGSQLNWRPTGYRISKPIDTKYDRRYLKKDGRYERLFEVGGRDIIVNYGKNSPTIASYDSKSGSGLPLNTREKQCILEAVNNPLPDYSGTLSFATLGMHNCDAFFRVKERTNQIVMITNFGLLEQDISQVEYYLMLDDFMVILGGKRDNQGNVHFDGAPLGARATMVAYQKGEAKSIFTSKELVTARELEILELHVMDNEMVDMEMMKLDRKF